MNDHIDHLAAADFERDRMKNTSSCGKCGYRDPVRLDPRGCEKCFDFPRCSVCNRWTGDGGFLPKAVGGVCTYCIAAWLKMQEEHR